MKAKLIKHIQLRKSFITLSHYFIRKALLVSDEILCHMLTTAIIRTVKTKMMKYIVTRLQGACRKMCSKLIEDEKATGEHEISSTYFIRIYFFTMGFGCLY